MDAIVRETGDLDGFLANADAQDRYFKSMQAYYGGDRVTRAKFDEIVEQLKTLAKEVPDLKRRLWETGGMGEPFSITLEATSYGRRLDNGAWTQYRNAMVEGLRRDAGAMDSPKAMATLAAFAKEAAKVGDTAREQREFYVAKKADPALRAAAAFLLHEKFQSEAMRDMLGSGDPNLILATMNAFRQGLRQAFARDGIDLGPAVSWLQDRVPSQPELLADEKMFPHEMRTTNRGKLVPAGRSGMTAYHFRPPPRRFHGIWKGLPLGECVGSSTAQRWATVALTGTQFYHVERVTEGPGGDKKIHYEGFTQHVPLASPRGEIIGSTDFGAPALAQKVTWQSPHLDMPVTLPLYDLWLGEIKKRLPKEWKGLVVGDSSHINNAGVLPTVRASASYKQGELLYLGYTFSHLDDFPRAISARTLNRETYGYSGDMIFDARANRMINLRLLGKSFSELAGSVKFFDEVRATFAGHDPAPKVALIDGLTAALPPAEVEKLLGVSPAYRKFTELHQAMKEAEAARLGWKVGLADLGSLASMAIMGASALQKISGFGSADWDTATNLTFFMGIPGTVRTLLGLTLGRDGSPGARLYSFRKHLEAERAAAAEKDARRGSGPWFPGLRSIGQRCRAGFKAMR